MNMKRLWYIVFSLLFVAEVAVISQHAETLMTAPWFFWIMGGFATLRLARTISFNAIGEPLRAPFVREVVDTSGAGNSCEPKPGPFEAVGELLTCPICTGTHMASLVVASYALNPSIGMALTVVLFFGSFSELLNWYAERAEWEGRLAREYAGTQWLRKNRGSELNAFNEDQKELVREILKDLTV